MKGVKIAVFGGTNMDILGSPAGQLLLRDSNIGSVELRPGGVGRNIADRLVQSGADCTFLTVFGSDWAAELLRADCQKRGIDVSHALSAQGNSCVYLCVHDETGDMFTGINAMALTEKLTGEYALSQMKVINGASLCVLDANVPAETLRVIAENARVSLLMDTVSCAKAERALQIMPYLTAIKPNIYEARLLTGCEDPCDCAKKLVGMGAKMAFVSLGEDGLCCADQTQCQIIPVSKKSSAAKTGAGDALCTGLALALADGKDMIACAQAGMASAAAFLESTK